jgi:hypothetical protein
VGAKPQKGICASGAATVLEYPKVRENPQIAPKIPRKLEYLCRYVEDIPYMRAQQVGETP